MFQVAIEGHKGGKSCRMAYDLVDVYDPETDATSIARTTGYTCIIVARQVLNGPFTRKGICPLEFVGRTTGCFEDLSAGYETVWGLSRSGALSGFAEPLKRLLRTSFTAHQVCCPFLRRFAMSKLKAAVIGVGSMGSRHARIYAELPETELVGAVGATETNCVRIAARYGGRAYTDYEKMLTTERPDLVSVAVPTVLHLEVAKAALAAGCHVLVEKPIADTVEAARALIVAAEAAERKLMVGHIVRFDPPIRALKQHMDAGELGCLHQVVCRRIGPFPYRVQDVGVGLDLAPHDLDLLRYITGEAPLSVYAETTQRLHAEHEDLLTALLRFPSGVVGMLQLNWLTPTRARDVDVLGARGMLRADCVGQTLTFFENGDVEGAMPTVEHGFRGVTVGRTIQFPLPREEPIRAELAAFVAAVLNDTDVPVTGADGLAALRLALAVVASGNERRLVEI
ncbi:MAG: Gfo/Idh/MocA family oxidoreductase [Anaerolineae bacterium]|nr:Gfo/Idh/MocA family oxidoreductase [Anaerolineae bacterium]